MPFNKRLQRLSFKTKTNKDKQYISDFAPVITESNSKQLSVLAQWYGLNAEGKTSLLENSKCFYQEINSYLATLSDKVVQKLSDRIGLLPKELDLIKLELAWYQKNDANE